MQKPSIRESEVTGIKFGTLAEFAAAANPERSILVADEKVFHLYGEAFAGTGMPVLLLPSGETAKSLDSLRLLYRGFADRHVDRSWKAIALGGGALLDAAGFGAATWMRGIPVVYAPTTLLSMVDASLGGKTGIDFEGKKNLVGLFSVPELVLCDLGTLSSLSDREFSSGMAEVIKHAILVGGEIFSFLEQAAGRFIRREKLPERTLRRLVSDSQKVKSDIVARDPFERGERRLLNLGHTFGHALESSTGLPHGHAVSLGISLACDFACGAGELDSGDASRIRFLLESWGLPTETGTACTREELRGAVRFLDSDKKRAGVSVHFVLPLGIGRVETRSIPLETLRDFYIRRIG